MPEAVIVSTARTPIGTAFKGTLVDVDALELATQVVAEAVRRAGHRPRADRRRRAGRDALRRWRHRPLRRHRGRPRPRRPAWPTTATARRASPRSPRRRLDPRRHGPRGRGRWRAVVVHLAPRRPAGCPAPTTGTTGCRPPTATARRARTWTCRSPSGGTPPSRPASPVRRWTPGRCARTSGPSPPSTAARFVDEIVRRRGHRSRRHDVDASTVDEHPRRDITMEKLASLKPLHPEIEGFSITAGNAAGVNDGAAAMVVADRAPGRGSALEPLATVRAWASAGVDPTDTGLAPTVAIPKALGRAGLEVDDVDLWEINEAFASMCVATTPDPGHRRGDGQRARQRLQPRPPDRHDRRPHGDLARPRAAPPRRRHRRRRDVRRRRHVDRRRARRPGAALAGQAAQPRGLRPSPRGSDVSRGWAGGASPSRGDAGGAVARRRRWC